MWKILKIIICLVICLGILVPAQGESGFEPRDTKAYESVENVYKMDFSVSDLKEYTSKDEWAISSASSAVIENGKLTCKSGRSFSIGPVYLERSRPWAGYFTLTRPRQEGRYQ